MNEFGRLRVGVVGGGYWGSKHVRALSAIDAVEKVVVIDPSGPRLEALTRTFSHVATYPALPLALDEVDAVVIATPPDTHTPLALAAIQAGTASIYQTFVPTVIETTVSQHSRNYRN